MRTAREHDRTDTRWLDYELDVTKLLDYPLMTDMRDPLTQRFHRAKLRADLLRPADPGDLLDDSDAAREYLDAVEEYVTAFDVAEAEAIRRRRSDFSREEQQRLSRAHSALRIASDTAATPQERERAFDVARAGTRRSDRAARAHPRRDRARNRRRARQLAASSLRHALSDNCVQRGERSRFSGDRHGAAAGPRPERKVVCRGGDDGGRLAGGRPRRPRRITNGQVPSGAVHEPTSTSHLAPVSVATNSTTLRSDGRSPVRHPPPHHVDGVVDGARGHLGCNRDLRAGLPSARRRHGASSPRRSACAG